MYNREFVAVRALRRQMERRRENRKVAAFAGWFVFLFIILLFVSSLGCATAPVQQPVSIAASQSGPAGWAGRVRLAQMGEDCAAQDELLERLLRGLIAQAGAPQPATIEMDLSPGSSLCGDSQGTAAEVAMLDLGSRGLAEAEVRLGWTAISREELARASKLLGLMRPATK